MSKIMRISFVLTLIISISIFADESHSDCIQDSDCSKVGWCNYRGQCVCHLRHFNAKDEAPCSRQVSIPGSAPFVFDLLLGWSGLTPMINGQYWQALSQATWSLIGGISLCTSLEDGYKAALATPGLVLWFSRIFYEVTGLIKTDSGAYLDNRNLAL